MKVDQGITWFLNLCYSYDVNEKNLTKSKTSKFEWLTPFGDPKEGFMLGIEDFPVRTSSLLQYDGIVIVFRK